MRKTTRRPTSGVLARRRFVVLTAILAGTVMLLASCGEDDKNKPGGGYQFPGAKQDEKGQYKQGNPI